MFSPVIYRSDATKDFRAELENKFYVIKPVKAELPTFSYDNVGNLLIEQRDKIIQLLINHAQDAEAVARYQVQLQAIDQTLSDLGLVDPNSGVVNTDLDALFIEIPDIVASPGSIFIESDLPNSIYTPFIGDELIARAGAKIDIQNETPFALTVNDAIIQDNRRVAVAGDELVILKPGHIYNNNIQIDNNVIDENEPKTIQITQNSLGGGGVL